MLSACERASTCKADGKDNIHWTGQCVEGFAEGYGTATFESSYKRSIEGTFFKGEPNGEVKIQYTRGGSYIGGMKDGKFHGYGKWVTDVGKTYIGKWELGHMSGDGLFIHEDGRETPGFWKPIFGLKRALYVDKFNGCEIWWAPNPQYPLGDTVWSGNCVDGKGHGIGTLKWTEGIEGEPMSRTVSFEGHLEHGQLSGEGVWEEKQFYANLTHSIKIEAVWKESMVSGFGKKLTEITFIEDTEDDRETSLYEGGFFENQFSGTGKLEKIVYALNGETSKVDKSGQFNENKLQGFGKQTYQFLIGDVLFSQGGANGKFENDEFIGFGNSFHQVYKSEKDLGDMPTKSKRSFPGHYQDGGVIELVYSNGDQFTGEVSGFQNDLGPGVCTIKKFDYHGPCVERVFEQTEYSGYKCLMPPEGKFCLIKTSSWIID